LIDLQTFGSTFGIGGGAIAPLHPLATRLIADNLSKRIIKRFCSSFSL